MVKKQLSITMEREVVEEVDEIAEDYDMSRSEVIENCVKKTLGKRSIFSEGILRGGGLDRELR